VIYRRYYAGLRNVRNHYLPLADTAAIYDNSGERRILIAEKESGMSLLIRDAGRWARMEQLALWK
jgi:predicted ABC-type ATPase